MSSTTRTTPTTAEQKRENFAHNSQNSNGISLVIPRVYPNWNYRKIKQVFIQCGWGFVERVDVVPVGRIPKGRFKTAFVHFRPNSWNNRDQQARDVLEKLTKGPSNSVQITYDEPWYWKVFISSAQRTAEAPKPPPRPDVKIPDTASEEEFPTIETTYDLSAQQDAEDRAGKAEHMRDRFEDRNEEVKFDYTNTM
tara:strand:- start:76 stop:660 length:585 start_codon:yes stop_codon:yes gene_type:complete